MLALDAERIVPRLLRARTPTSCRNAGKVHERGGTAKKMGPESRLVRRRAIAPATEYLSARH